MSVEGCWIVAVLGLLVSAVAFVILEYQPRTISKVDVQRPDSAARRHYASKAQER
jgi:hypothetical protein